MSGPRITVWFEVTFVSAEAEASVPRTPKVWASLSFEALRTFVYVPIPMFWLVVKLSAAPNSSSS